MLWQTVVLALTTMVAAQQINEVDDSDYIDDDDESITKSVWVSDIISTTSETTRRIQGEVEKLLGQPIIHYEEPDNKQEEPSSPDEAPTRTRIGQAPTRSTGPSESSIEPPWNELVAGIGLSSYKAMRSQPRGRYRTEEGVYSVRVPQWGGDARFKQKGRPGVIESLVNGHEIVRYETPRHPFEGYPPLRPYRDPARMPVYATRMRNANQTAYNEGGFRYRTSPTFEDEQNVLRKYPSGRRDLGLVTVPAAHLTDSTRRPRPTPVTRERITTYKYTRKTRRHPNCTDNYYDCLLKCFDKKGYRVKCPWDTTTRGEPNRMNFTGLFHAIHQNARMTEYDVSNIFWSWKDQLHDRGYRSCRTFTTRTTTTKKIYPIYYDDVLGNDTGTIVAKCWVCGLTEYGIPHNSYCSDNFRDVGSSMALAEKNSYRRYCRYMDEVPLWFNRSDPFSVWGPWTGGCSWRWLDMTGLYTQRACRSVTIPATGNHFLSKRMAQLELALSEVVEGCVVSPMATLVPFSRAISLYARFHVCVCKGMFCNQASLKEPSFVLIILYLVVCMPRMLQLADVDIVS